MPKKNYIEADVTKNNIAGQMELDLPNITYDELPCVSVLTITYQRKHFFQLMWNNWNNYKYPKEKIEWVIIDDSPGDTDDLTDIIPQYPNIRYIRLSEHMTVGAKRNYGVEQCRYDLIVHQDDDDYYFPDSILAKVRILKRYPKCGCCFSNSLAAYNIMNNISYMMDPQNAESCLSLPEATMMYKRSFWQQQHFPESHFGEGKGFAIGREKKFVSIPCVFNMVSFTHSRNMTGLARNVETKSINTDKKLSNYYDLFDGMTKNIIRKLIRLTNKELIPTKYDNIWYINFHEEEVTCSGDTCKIKYLGKDELNMLSNISNWSQFKINDFDTVVENIGTNDLILACWYSKDLMNMKNNVDLDKLPKTDVPVDLSRILKHPRAKLFLYNSWECRNIVDPYIKSQLSSYCINHLKIPLDKIIVATTDFKNPLVHSLSPQIIGYDFPYLYAKAQFNPSEVQDTTSTHRTKAICMFSRRGNIERTAASLFLHTFYNSNTLMSYLTIDKYPENEIKKYGVTCSKYNEFTKLLPIIPNNSTDMVQYDEEAAKVYDNPMVKVDWESQDDIRNMISESFVMLMIETNGEGFASHSQQVSEKTYKPIKMGMPFITFTSKPGILKHLKSLGFKTFHPYIDESYDYPTVQEKTEDAAILEKEYYDRFRKLLKELNRICKMSQPELVELWESCQPIVQHNLRILQSQDSQHILPIPVVEK